MVKLLASALLPLLELAAAAEHAVLPMLAVLELAMAVLPVLELAAVVAVPAMAAHHASHHVPTSTVAAVRNFVCSVSGGSSCCASSQHAAHAHASSMATTVTG
jgi:hypothetical protein